MYPSMRIGLPNRCGKMGARSGIDVVGEQTYGNSFWIILVDSRLDARYVPRCWSRCGTPAALIWSR